MDHHTCKFYNGDFHNTHCLAGVAYRDVTTDPDRIDGVAFRKPCINWDSWHKERNDDFSNEGQRQNWQQRAGCSKWEAPTQGEIDAEDAAHKECIAESLEVYHTRRCARRSDCVWSFYHRSMQVQLSKVVRAHLGRSYGEGRRPRFGRGYGRRIHTVRDRNCDMFTMWDVGN